MKKTLDTIRTGIYLTMCILFASLIYTYLTTIFIHSTETWLIGFIIISAIVIIDYLSRRYIKNLFAFFGVHMGLILLTIFLPRIPLDKVFLTAISISFLLMAINYWQTEVNERTRIVIDVPLGCIALFILAYLQSSIFIHYNPFTTFAYYSGIVFFLLFFVREYLDKFFAYALSSGNFSDELKRTFSTNISLLALFNALIIFAIMTVNMFFSNSSFNVVGRFLKWIFRGIFSCLPTDKPPIEMPDGTPGTGEPLTDGGATFISPEDMSNGGINIGNILFAILQVVIYIGIALGVIFAIYTFIKLYLHRNHNDGDIIKPAEKQEIKKVKLKEKGSTEKKSFFMDNREKVRKLFTKKVDKATKANEGIVIRKSYTPKQIDETLVKEQAVAREEMDAATSVYEKARYSNHEITKEDVEIFNRAGHPRP